MNNVQRWLQESDPVPREPALSRDDAQRMRCAVLTAAEERTPFVTWWRGALAAATLAVACFAVIGIRHVWEPADPQAVPIQSRTDAPVDQAEPESPRQLQFATPGGTRVIWTFNPNFKL